MGGTGVATFPGAPGSRMTLSNGALGLTGLDIQARVVLPHALPPGGSTVPTILSQYVTGNWSWHFFVSGSTPTLQVSTNGTSSFGSAVCSTTLEGKWLIGWLRCTLNVNAGAYFYTAPDSNDAPSVWTQLGSFRTLVPGSLYNSTTALRIGGNGDNSFRYFGEMRRVILYNGVGGTKIVDADFTKQHAGTTSFVEDASGLTVTVNGSARICNRVGA